MYKFQFRQGFLFAFWLGLQGAAGLSAESISVERSLAPQGKAQADTQLRSIVVLAKTEELGSWGAGELGRVIPLNATGYESLNPPSLNLQPGLRPAKLTTFKPSTFNLQPGLRPAKLTTFKPSTFNLQPSNLQPSKTLLAKSISCPSDVETLIPLLLRDLPGYATRVMRRSRRPTSTAENPIYFVLAGRPEFEPLTLGPGQYTTPTPTADLEPPKQVFFTTLERQYRDGKASYRQIYHWLFLTQTTEGWRIAMMFSRIGSAAAGRPPTPPEESSRGVVGQAVRIWLRDCRAGAIRESRNRTGALGGGEAGGAGGAGGRTEAGGVVNSTHSN